MALTLLLALSTLAQDPQLIDIGTHKLKIVCTGEAASKPVVIFEAGGGGTSASWKAVQSALPPSIRSCAYGRAGSGKSDPGPDPRSMDAEVTDLNHLLQKLDINEPILFVGHSLGGILARLFLDKYPASVTAMLLADPTDEHDLVYNTKVNRWITVRELEDDLGDGARLVAASRKANPAPLGTRPLTVIWAGKRNQPPGIPEELWQQMRSAKNQRVKALAALSGNSTFILDPASSHNIERDNPTLIAAEIEKLLQKLKKP